MILYMHLCSFGCATGIISCCGEEQEDHCSATSHHENEDGDCQKDHLTFFSTVGQNQVLTAEVIKYFPLVIAINCPAEINQPKDVFHISEIYTGFHPPPPKKDVRIFIQSFLI